MSRLSDPSLLNPTFGDRLFRLQLKLQGTGLAIFETARSPERQTELKGQRVSRANAYQSAHQYGLAVDLVFHDEGKWAWPDIEDPRWEPIRAHASSCGLETLSFERPHVQLAGFDWRQLAAGPMDTPGWMAWLNERNKT